MISWLVGGAIAFLLLVFLGALRGYLGKRTEAWIERAVDWLGDSISRIFRVLQVRLLPPKVDPRDLLIGVPQKESGEPTGILIDLTGSPFLELQFDVTNKSVLNVVLDRLLINVSVAEPILIGFGQGVFERTEIKKGATVRLKYATTLNPEQARVIGKQAAFIQNENAWEVRVRIHFIGLFTSRRGYIATGERFQTYDVVRLAGTPPRPTAALGSSPVDEGVAKRKQRIKDAVADLSAALTDYAAGNYPASGPNELISRIGEGVSLLKVEYPNLFYRLDQIASYINDYESPRSAGYVHDKLITPLILDGRQYWD